MILLIGTESSRLGSSLKSVAINAYEHIISIHRCGFTLTEDGCQFGLCKSLSDATMVAVSKSKSIFIRPFAIHIKFVWICEDVGVPVRGLIGSNDALISFNKLVSMSNVSINEHPHLRLVSEIPCHQSRYQLWPFV